MESSQLKHIVEAALLAAGRPLAADELRALVGEGEDAPSRQEIRAAVAALEADYAPRGICIREVAGGFRIQVDPAMAGWLGKLFEGRPPRYSRALLETLAIIAYRQPVTRGEVEEIRGVSVTTQIMRTLLERGWVRVVGHRDVPGKPAMYGTTRDFLDYFGLKSLDELPALAELRDLDALNVQLELPETGEPDAWEPSSTEEVPGDDAASPDPTGVTAGDDTPGVEAAADANPRDGGADVPSGDATAASDTDQADEVAVAETAAQETDTEIAAGADERASAVSNVVPLKGR